MANAPTRLAAYIAEANRLANEMTPARRRAEHMGWQFTRIEVAYAARFDAPVIYCYFKCVCGAEEGFNDILDDSKFDHRVLDVAARLANMGAFSRKHLLEDGYTAEQITEFERKGAEFDALERANG